MLQRALIRADIPLCYSQGFNPRPKLSLPLPRSVGVLSDDELFCAQVSYENIPDLSSIQESLSAQLPHGCVITNIELKNGKVKFHPAAVSYRFELEKSVVNKALESSVRAIEDACNGKLKLIVNRNSGKNKPARELDVSCYIDSVNRQHQSVVFNCFVTQKGSVRVDEMLTLLKLETKDLAGPVKRESVKWSQKIIKG